jgi:hypothetical protein
MSPWVLRLVLDPKKLGELLEVGQLDMDQINTKITDYYGSGIVVIIIIIIVIITMIIIIIVIINTDQQFLLSLQHC